MPPFDFPRSVAPGVLYFHGFPIEKVQKSTSHSEHFSRSLRGFPDNSDVGNK